MSEHGLARLYAMVGSPALTRDRKNIRHFDDLITFYTLEIYDPAANKTDDSDDIGAGIGMIIWCGTRNEFYQMD